MGARRRPPFDAIRLRHMEVADRQVLRALGWRATRRCLAFLGLNSRPDYIKRRLRRARYDSFRDRPNCRVLRSPSVDHRYFGHAAGAWSRGLRCRAVLNQYGYRGFDFPGSAMASAPTGVAKRISKERYYCSC